MSNGVKSRYISTYDKKGIWGISIRHAIDIYTPIYSPGYP